MKKIWVILIMLAGLVNTAMAVQLNVIRENVEWRADQFHEINIDSVPEVVMNAFDQAYQNIGIEKIEVGKAGNTNVYKFTIITYERKEKTVYFSEVGEEIKY